MVAIRVLTTISGVITTDDLVITSHIGIEPTRATGIGSTIETGVKVNYRNGCSA